MSAVLVLSLLGLGEATADELVTLKWHTGVFGTSLGYADRLPYWGAVRFTPAFGCTLSRVRWFQSGDAGTAYVFLWGPGTEDEPGTMIGESMPGDTGVESWHEVAVPDNRRFAPNQDFWVGVRMAGYQVTGGKYPLGADAGPQVPPKRSLYASRDRDSWHHISPPPPQYDRNWLLEADVQVESLTGASEGELTTGIPCLHLGPNPVRSGVVTLSLNGPLARWSGTPVKIGIYNAAGRLVLSQVLSVERQASDVTLDLRSMPTGAYVVRLNVGGHPVTRKILIQR